MRKFEDPNGGDVNYVAFVEAVDKGYTGQVMAQKKERERWLLSELSDFKSSGLVL